jgi:hypothetical protein
VSERVDRAGCGVTILAYVCKISITGVHAEIRTLKALSDN